MTKRPKPAKDADEKTEIEKLEWIPPGLMADGTLNVIKPEDMQRALEERKRFGFWGNDEEEGDDDDKAE